MMKTLLTLFVLFFSSSVVAEDISDFKIEGMSLGDSVIDHFPGRDVVNNITSKYDHLSDEFHVSELYRHKNFKKYDEVHLVIKSDSEEILFPIYGISGFIYYEKNIENCYAEKDKIVLELQTIFKDVKIEGPTIFTHPSDTTGKSKYEENKFNFDGGFARVACYDMSDSMQIMDAMAIDIFYQAVDEWLSGVNSNDISDFEIEGISIKDSMLDFLSEKQIKNNTKDFYRTDDFIPVQIEGSYFNSEMYDVVEFNYKNGDKNYIIYNISGLNYPKDINDCYKKQKEILEELNDLFGKVKGIRKNKLKEYNHGADPSGKSTYTRGGFIFSSLDQVNVDCNDFSNESGYIDEMYVSVDSKEFYNF